MVDCYHAQGFRQGFAFLFVVVYFGGGGDGIGVVGGMFRKVDSNSRLGETSPRIINPHWIIRRSGIARHIAHDPKPPPPLAPSLPKLLFRDERRDGRITEIHAVDEDIGFRDLVEWPPARGLRHIPFGDVGGGDAGALEEGDGAGAAAAQRADDEAFWGRGVVEGGGEGGFDSFQEVRGGWVEGLSGEWWGVRVEELVGVG